MKIRQPAWFVKKRKFSIQTVTKARDEIREAEKQKAENRKTVFFENREGMLCIWIGGKNGGKDGY